MDKYAMEEIPFRPGGTYRSNSYERRARLQGPLRCLRLCILAIILPGLIVSVPIYLK